MKLNKQYRIIFPLIAAGLLMTAAPLCVYAEGEDDGFTAVVTSDLHFTGREKSASMIVPGVGVAEEIMRTFTAEVIDRRPDAWIITGDLTNSGKPDDMQMLSSMLEKAQQAGIEVVVTTGNHDYDKGEMEAFEDLFLSLPHILSRDEASLSYSVRCENVRLLAMDDTDRANENIGAGAAFSEETMQWLRGQLEEAADAGEKCLFLSHRSVLFETQYKAGVDYTIRNEDLKGLLQEYGVQLCLTGHQHTQSIFETDGMYEIISCMPLTGKHRFGWLTMEDDHVTYEGDQIDFGKYANEEDRKLVENADQLAAEQSAQTVDLIIGEDASDEMKELLGDFFAYYEEGVLGAHVSDIVENEAWPNLHEALAETNYGPWMDGLLEDPPRDAFHLEF